jgi:predicted AlkP superfamily phosphohydrolase/phosphomutase
MTSEKEKIGNFEARRLLVIGLDGGTFTILQPLMESKTLPNLAQFQQRGCWGFLLSTIPPVTAPAWVSFMTGVNPARHGIFHFFRRDASGYAYEKTSGFVHAHLLHRPTLWDILSQAGKRVGVINIPLTYPPKPINGFMITGMLTPPQATNFFYPPELSEKLKGYKIDLDGGRTSKEFSLEAPPREDELIRDVNALLECRAAHTLQLIAEEEWDCFIIVFEGPDRLFHELWRYLDPDFPAYNSARGEIVRHAVEMYLSRLDAIISQLRTLAGTQTTTIVMSDHGFGPAPGKRVNLNEWLVAKGLLHLAKGGRSWLQAEFWAAHLGLRRTSIKRHLERWVPLRLLRRMTTDKKGDREIPADWQRTRAYSVQIYNHICGIEINLKGRKPQGIVEPGSEYQQLRDWLLAEVINLYDPETGTRLVRSAHRREEIFDGEFIEQAPDIVIELDPKYAGFAPLGNAGVVTPHNPRRQGEHRQEGIFLVQGPEIISGVHVLPSNITDLAPTILYALGVPVPREMDGRVLLEIFDPQYALTHPISYMTSTPSGLTKGNTNGYSAEEEAEIVARLRNLGYIR